jgi:hypothetical protein
VEFQGTVASFTTVTSSTILYYGSQAQETNQIYIAPEQNKKIHYYTKMLGITPG